MKSTAQYNKLNLAKFLLAHPKIDINKTSKIGWSPLAIACESGQTEMVELLLNDPHINNDNDRPLNRNSLLHDASMRGDIKIFELLLNHPQTDINQVNKDLHDLIKFDWKDQVKILKIILDHPEIDSNTADNYSGTTLLERAYFANDEESFKLLMAHPKINLNAGNCLGYTLLHTICTSLNYSKKEEKIFTTLLDHPQIDVNKPANNGSTALETLGNSYFTDRTMLNNLLFHPSIDLNIRFSTGKTFFTVAEKKGRKDVIEILKECFGVDKNTIPEDGKKTATKNVLNYVLMKESHNEKKKYTGDWLNWKDITKSAKKLAQDQAIPRLFGLTVFLCDDFLSLKTDPALNNDPALRFFNIAKQLPMELQMVLAHRAFRSGKNNILSKDSEAAFRYLAKTFLLESTH